MANPRRNRRPDKIKKLAQAELRREIKLVSRINGQLNFPGDFTDDHMRLAELLSAGKDLRDAGAEMGGKMPRELWPLLLELV